jgi:four helix bundle protein
MPQEKKIYDLEERSAVFGEKIILFLKKVPRNTINDVLIRQLARAGTSVGANYSEADDAVSKKDFKNKIGICKKESRECKHFLRMIWTAEPKLEREAKVLWQEAKELNLIFNAIFNKL